MSNDKKGASQKILEKLDLLIETVEAMDKSNKIQLTNLLNTVEQHSTVLAGLEKSRPKSSTRKKAAPAQTPTGPHKYNNKMLFVKDFWVKDREEWKEKYFTAEYDMEGEWEIIEQEMQSDKNKKKSGDAKSRAEATYFWNKYLKGKNKKEKLYDAIAKAYETYNNAINAGETDKTADTEADESEEGESTAVATEEEETEGETEATEEEKTPAKKTTKKAAPKKVTRKRTTKK
jgi:hypothetical protein